MNYGTEMWDQVSILEASTRKQSKNLSFVKEFI